MAESSSIKNRYRHCKAILVLVPPKLGSARSKLALPAMASVQPVLSSKMERAAEQRLSSTLWGSTDILNAIPIHLLCDAGLNGRVVQPEFQSAAASIPCFNCHRRSQYGGDADIGRRHRQQERLWQETTTVRCFFKARPWCSGEASATHRLFWSTTAFKRLIASCLLRSANSRTDT